MNILQYVDLINYGLQLTYCIRSLVISKIGIKKLDKSLRRCYINGPYLWSVFKAQGKWFSLQSV
jgi:hypothetical protein